MNMVKAWLIFVLSIEESEEKIEQIQHFLIQTEISYFINNFLQIVENYPQSIQSINGMNLQNLRQSMSVYEENYLHNCKEKINDLCGDCSLLIVFYIRIVRVCIDLSISSSLLSFLLKPFQEAIFQQDNWISALFLVISRDYPVRNECE